ncbi:MULTISPECIES: hypothetical protein [Acinetobacter]|uniref:Uncharacterized protein n=1 Tax=Acinetobacter piscicola TaxID=2006115 RepID=A0A4Q4GXT1_9GAMM|nr:MULTISPECIES: hypothetical protein [Acinetobacter]MDM1757082.1 hypothetical protein [Acinetobacter sp. 256-1]MDM1760135.1 hypothetical protein [Acinetobacter sp. 251-1]QOW46245.1 hypothetical protein G0028_10265 [Acinetobacter piscicola]RYL27103.1 hypothetical protein EWP19_06880 [Acinetobacter piscicola]
MQFFDLSQKFNLDDILVPHHTLDELKMQEWFLSKVRVDHDCLSTHDFLEGQAILKSNKNIEIELEWQIMDTGHSLQVLFKGIETIVSEQTLIVVKGAHLVDATQRKISTQALSLWIDGTLLPLLPNIRSEIKARLNLWDYVEYTD